MRAELYVRVKGSCKVPVRINGEDHNVIYSL